MYDELTPNHEVCDCPINYQVNGQGSEKQEKHHQKCPSAISGSI